jgi:hypothetical protein
MEKAPSVGSGIKIPSLKSATPSSGTVGSTPVMGRSGLLRVPTISRAESSPAVGKAHTAALLAKHRSAGNVLLPVEKKNTVADAAAPTAMEWKLKAESRGPGIERVVKTTIAEKTLTEEYVNEVDDVRHLAKVAAQKISESKHSTLPVKTKTKPKRVITNPDGTPIVYKYDRTSVVPYAELVEINRSKDYQGLIQKYLERYLAREEFESVFKMTRVRY